jgi:hypothetical protein
MIKFFVFFIFSSVSYAYIPTVESLLKHGANPEVGVNGIVITLVVKKSQINDQVTTSINDVALLKDEKEKDFYKIYMSKTEDGLKVAQVRFGAESFSDSSIIHKIYFSGLNPFTLKSSVESAEKGVFFGLLNSVVFNNGSYLLNYLKSLGVPVKLNNEIINREKVEFLADYKRYLFAISKNRNAKKSLMNPLYPSDPLARERVNSIMASPMYTDTNQVKLSKEDGQMVWVAEAGTFRTVVSHNTRDILGLSYKSIAGDFELYCKDYWTVNGAQMIPRFILVKTFNGQKYEVEITGVRYYQEREEDLQKRLKNWDKLLSGKDSSKFRPEFLL